MKKKSLRIWILWISSAILILLSALFKPSEATEFTRSLNDKPWAHTTVTQPTRAGATAQQFLLRPGDCGAQPGWSDCATDRERIEFSQTAPYTLLNTTSWTAFSIYLDPQWQDISPVTTTLAQFHHRDSATPAVLFVQRNNGYYLRIESAKSLYPGQDHHLLLPLDAMRGRWTDIVIQARWANNPSGAVRVWVNGRLTVAFNGVTTLGTTPIFFKYGIYRSFVSRRPDRAHHLAVWDEVRLGPTRAAVDRHFNPQLPPVD